MKLIYLLGFSTCALAFAVPVGNRNVAVRNMALELKVREGAADAAVPGPVHKGLYRAKVPP